MSFAGTLQSMFVAHDGLGTLVAMGAWCGAYAGLHEGLYALSKALFPPLDATDDNDDDERSTAQERKQKTCPRASGGPVAAGETKFENSASAESSSSSDSTRNNTNGEKKKSDTRTAEKNGGAQRDLDAPCPKYYGTSLRRVSTARVVALTHAVASWAWSLIALWKRWPALRDPARLAGRHRRYLLWLSSSLSSSGKNVDAPTEPLRSLPECLWRPWLAYDDARGPLETAFMRHSLGYFVQELAHVLRHEPDPVFVAHHVLYLSATFPVCSLTRVGWPMIAVATALAEGTNPLQLAWEMARAYERRDAYDALSLPFTLLFTLVRGVAMPVFFCDMANYIWSEEKNDVLSAVSSECARATGDFSGAPDLLGRRVMIWTFSLFFGGIAASILWLALLVKGFLRYRRKRQRNGGSSSPSSSSSSSSEPADTS